MEELDPESRDALRRYREQAVLAAPARDRVLRRLDAAMQAAEAAPPPERPARSPGAATIVVLTAFAAAIVLALCDLSARRGGAPRADDSVAPYTAPSPSSGRAQPRLPVATTQPEPTSPPEPALNRDPTPDLTAELALLQRARAALDAHDFDAALRHLGEHAREFPDGQMREDRQLLRIEALCARGDAAQARAAASGFLREFPGSPHADRARNFCAESVTDRRPGGESQP